MISPLQSRLPAPRLRSCTPDVMSSRPGLVAGASAGVVGGVASHRDRAPRARALIDRESPCVAMDSEAWLMAQITALVDVLEPGTGR